MKKFIAVLLALLMVSTLTLNAFAAAAGDVNGDAAVNSMDALEILNYIVGNENKAFVEANADVNGDGEINSADALRVLEISVGNETANDDCKNHDGHDWYNWVTVIEPTAESQGKIQRECDNCKMVETKLLDKLDDKDELCLEVLRLVNIEREKVGAEPLKYYYGGQELADIRAEELTVKFEHERPDGTLCFTVLDEVHYFAAGENIAWGQSSPQEVVNSWMNSEGHRKNILNDNYEYLIVGVEGKYWVQLFIG